MMKIYNQEEVTTTVQEETELRESLHETDILEEIYETCSFLD